MRTPCSIGTTTVDSAESRHFATLSGDFNPLHVDPVTARRYQFGGTLIHGINSTLRALDLFFATRKNPVALDSLEVRFSRPVRQGETIEVFVVREDPSSAQIVVRNKGKKAQTVNFRFVPSAHSHEDPDDREAPESVEPRSPCEISIDDAPGMSGVVPVAWKSSLFAELFSNLADVLPSAQSATVLATTQLVGMILPGLNSVFGSLKLDFASQCPSSISDLGYAVTETDARFSRVVMNVSNAVVTGEIEAFFRDAPVKQASFHQIKSLVREHSFDDQSALIVGGSRGLGEVTAKLLAAGGAKVVVTYASGRDDAEAVAREINDGGGRCDHAELNVQIAGQAEALVDGCGPITHIYYMASPLIEKQTDSLWDAGLFQKFAEFYLKGLADLLAPLARNPEYRGRELTVYLPSTVFLDQSEKGFSEYTVAKAAVESFARQLQTKYPTWKVHTPRLPRMLTDQTSGYGGLDLLDNARSILTTLPGLKV